MKKILSVLLILGLCVAFFALGQSSGTTEIENQNPTPSEKLETNEVQQENNDSIDITLVDPDFKVVMDEYEAFIDEYIYFLENYDENDLNMLTDYMNYIEQFSATMEAISDIDPDQLDTADSLYYLEVSTRIMNKIANIE